MNTYEIQNLQYILRPVRLAVVVEPNTNISFINKVIEKLTKIYSGRFTQFALSENGHIDDDWIELLKAYDPDIIYSSNDLDEATIIRIFREISPAKCETIKDIKFSISENFVTAMPTEKHLIKMLPYYFRDNYEIINFKTDKLENEDLKSFIHYNFGKFTWNMPESIKNITINTIEINNEEDFNLNISKIFKLVNQPIFPIQLCAVADAGFYVKDHYRHSNFTVHIGDTSKDIASCWNRTLLDQGQERSIIRHLWIPENILTSNKLSKSITDILKFCINYQSHQNKPIHIISSKYNKTQLENLTKKISDPMLHMVFEHESKVLIPEIILTGTQLNFSPKQAIVVGRNTYLFDSSLIPESTEISHIYVADLLIIYGNSKISNQQNGFKYPQNNNLAGTLFPDHTNSKRINSNNYPSIFISKKNCDVKINSVDKYTLFYYALVPSNLLMLKSLKRITNIETIEDFSKSDKGFYLLNFINMFGSLNELEKFLGNKLWREVFYDLSQYNTRSDISNLERIKNLIEKNIDNLSKIKENPETKDWFVDRIYKMYNQMQSKERYFTFEQFEKAAISALKKIDTLGQTYQYGKVLCDEIKLFEEKKHKIIHKLLIKNGYLSAYNEILGKYNPQKQTFDNLPDELAIYESDLLQLFNKNYQMCVRAIIHENINELIEKKIILIGVNNRCNNCNIEYWYSLEELKHETICKGCGTIFHPKSNHAWAYKINSLIEQGIKQGTVPVCLALHQLQLFQNVSFEFYPQLDIYLDKLGNKKELDIVCLKEGKLIIGEIKESAVGFHEKDFENMELLAKLIRPHKVIYSSLDEKVSKTTLSKVQALAKKLESYKIKVEWMQLSHYYFEEAPI